MNVDLCRDLRNAIIRRAITSGRLTDRTAFEMTIQVTINGETQTLPAGLSVADLLQRKELNPRFLAVEQNRQLVPRARHAECIIQEADELEIVTLVGGG